MNPRLRDINRSLRALDEAHRLGRISREEYRARRRQLLSPLCDSGGITARNSLDAETVPRASVQTVPAARPAREDEAVSALFPRWTRWFAWTRWLGRRR